jgi:hypothetical protein
VLKKVSERQKVKSRIAEERKKLLEGVNLAKVQWQMVHEHQEGDCRKYDLLDILERRYMYLLNVAKKRKLHVIREG